MGISAARVVASTSVCAGGSFSVEGAASAANAETLMVKAKAQTNNKENSFSYQTFLSIKATNHLNPVIKKENIGINSFPVKKMSPHICSITVIHRIMDKFLRQKILAAPCLQG